MRRVSEEQIQSILSLRERGVPLRSIALHVLGRSSRESTVRGILQSYQGVNTARPVHKPNPAKILILDLETAPCIGYHWRRWKENISQAQSISESYILTWAAKWLNSPEIYSDTLVNYPRYDEDPEDDSHIIESLLEMIEEADMVVAHNGRRFDVPVLKTRMLYHGFDPIKSVRIIDTLDIAKKEFRFPSNALNSLAEYLGLGSKLQHEGFMLWRKVVEGDMNAWDHMLKYNEQDVVLLEDVYLLLRAWYSRHPNVALYGDLDEVTCPCCGSSDIKPTGQYDTTNVSKFPVYRCNDCGSVKSSRLTVLSKEQRANILRNTL